MQFSFPVLFLAAGSATISHALVVRKSATEQNFGVGFSLSLDYAVASIYYPDGSTVDLIKTEGSRTYRELMKSAAREALTVTYPTEDDASFSSIHPQDLEQQVLLQDRIDEFTDPIDAEEAMIDMFETLKIATESYTEQIVEIVDVAIPFPLIRSRLLAVIDAAYEANSLDYTNPPQLAGSLATKFNGLTGYCSDDSKYRDDPAKLILAVDWNRAAFTLNLLQEECGVVTWRRLEHDESLGDDGMRKCKADYGEEKCDQQLIAFIQKAVRPLEDDSAPTWVKTMLLVGEYSMSTKIMWLVKEELGKQYDPMEMSNPANRHTPRPVDPVFAAARGAGSRAYKTMALIRQQESEYDTEDWIEL